MKTNDKATEMFLWNTHFVSSFWRVWLLRLDSPLQSRTFTYLNGRKVEADFGSLVGKEVTLNISGTPTVVMLGLFSAADQKFIREAAAGAETTTPATENESTNTVKTIVFTANTEWKAVDMSDVQVKKGSALTTSPPSRSLARPENTAESLSRKAAILPSKIRRTCRDA